MPPPSPVVRTLALLDLLRVFIYLAISPFPAAFIQPACIDLRQAIKQSNNQAAGRLAPRSLMFFISHRSAPTANRQKRNYGGFLDSRFPVYFPSRKETAISRNRDLGNK